MDDDAPDFSVDEVPGDDSDDEDDEIDPTEGWVGKERPIRKEKQEFYRLEQFDYVKEATKKNVWYYRDRMSVPRGPCTMPVLRECWVHGIIDEDTLIWGHGLMDWLPIKNVRMLVPQIRTFEVQVATWLKRTISLKPALNRIRKERAEHRTFHTNQVDRME